MEESATYSTIIRFGAFEVDLHSGELRKKGLKIKLQEQPFQILAMLLQRPGSVVTREDLRKRLWPADTFVDFDQGLNRAINKIREALGDDAETPRYVETLPRRGYRFIAPVGEPANNAHEARGRHRWQEPTSVETAGPEPLRKVEKELRELQTPKTRRSLILASAAVGVLLATTAASIYLLVGGGRAIDSVAVLPFANLTADPVTDDLGDAITERLIINLSQVPRLRVISFSSVGRYRGGQADPQTAGRELGVRAVLVGRLTQRPGSMSIGMELVDVRDNSRLWGGEYEGTLADFLALQEEVSREIAANLQLRLSGEEKKRVEAYQLYLKGRNSWNKRTAEGINEGIQYLRQAIERDPNHALAYAALGDSYAMLSYYGALSPQQAFPKAKEAAQKALEINDRLAEAHTSLAYVRHRFDWDWSGAEDEFRRAIELNPSYAPAHQWYSSFLAAMGRVDEAVAEAKLIRKLDPLSPIINSHLGWVLYLAHQHDQAIAQCRMTLELEPNFFPARRYLGLAYEQSGLHKEAVAELQEAVVLSSNSPLTKAELAYAYAMSGKRPEAQRVLEELRERSNREYISPYFIATIYTGLGKKDEAFAWLHKAYEDRADGLVYLQVEPKFDRLRSDPRFQDLLGRMKFPEEAPSP
ncbi:MAG: winged helix-turn-helix domain-containing protein [Acidobacteria bacterium]|nr:winged helix-turn-helix domain-containing protein [Acidobacteriota bacterium]